MAVMTLDQMSSGDGSTQPGLGQEMSRGAEPSAMIGPCLSSDASSYCTGVDLLVDGGFRCW